MNPAKSKQPMRPLDQETDILIVKSYAKAVEQRLLEAEKIILSLQDRISEQSQLQIAVADQLSRLEEKFLAPEEGCLRRNNSLC